ncbi:MAG: ATP-binding cassette domain-containing protein [Mariprofundaceae bacterium]|nr:ATP-binding cassette domain-containing protein [Mariprofundaceae bacterium]
MIKADHLCRQYGTSFAVQNLSFEVQQGEVMGLLGPNGAGKSTTMKMLTCFLPPSSGDATIHGLSLSQSLQVRRLVGYLPEHAPSYHELDVDAYLQFIGKMHGLPPATCQDKVAEMSKACGLEQVMFRRIEELSKGFRQRVGLAASMLHDPKCLILDEPTTGLDPNQIIEIRHLIRRLAGQKTVLLSSHILPEVEAVCDRIMIIDQGQLQALGTPAELTKQAQGGLLLHVTIQGSGEQLCNHLSSTFSNLEIQHRESLDNGDTRYQFYHPDASSALAEATFHAAVATQAVLLEMRQEKASLEDVFRELTGGTSCT